MIKKDDKRFMGLGFAGTMVAVRYPFQPYRGTGVIDRLTNATELTFLQPMQEGAPPGGFAGGPNMLMTAPGRPGGRIYGMPNQMIFNLPFADPHIHEEDARLLAKGPSGEFFPPHGVIPQDLIPVKIF